MEPKRSKTTQSAFAQGRDNLTPSEPHEALTNSF
jgi:hypothetical protein